MVDLETGLMRNNYKTNYSFFELKTFVYQRLNMFKVLLYILV